MEKLQPKLRFQQFNDKWAVQKIRQIIKSIDSGWSPQCEEYPSAIDEWGVLKTTSVVWEGFNEKENKKLPLSLKPKENIEVVKDDILITRAGPANRVGVSVHVNNVRAKLMLSDKLIRLRTNEGYSSKFISIMLSLDYVQDQIVSKSSGLATSQTNISQNIILDVNLHLPTLSEQTEIAAFLSSVDEKLNLLKEKKAALEEYKKGIMQKIFSQEIRFKNTNGKYFVKWENKSLGEICDVNKGTQLNRDTLSESGLYPCISGGIEPSGYALEYNRNENTIIISEGGNSCGYVNFITNKFWCGGHCYSIDLKDDSFNKTYIFQALKYYQDEIMKLRVGSGLPNIQKKDLLKFNLTLSIDIEEQTKIASFLSAIDEKIVLVSKQIVETQEYKKGLLQQMFV